LSTTFNQPVSGIEVPRFGGMPTFMRLPYTRDPGDIDIALVGIPWDGGTTNRPGARHGPREIRNQSSFIRSVHPVTMRSPYSVCNVADMGDSSVNPIDVPDTLARVEEFYKSLQRAGTLPLSAGGDHLTTLPILRGTVASGPVGLIQFDAHTDTNDTYFGDNRYTHGTPFRRAIEENLVDPKRMIQIGIRGSLYSEQDYDYCQSMGIRMITIEEYFDIGPDAAMAEARRVVGDQPTYITFDIDSLDPIYAPGTGTPEIGGISTFEAQKMIRQLAGLNLIGADVVEVAPPFDPSGNTALTGANIMFELLCILAECCASAKS
jgi:guanidinopropionase